MTRVDLFYNDEQNKREIIRVNSPFSVTLYKAFKTNNLNYLVMAKRTITVAALADELNQRLNSNQTVDCCKDELINLANLAKEKIGGEMVEVNWES